MHNLQFLLKTEILDGSRGAAYLDLMEKLSLKSV